MHALPVNVQGMIVQLTYRDDVGMHEFTRSAVSRE